jgi:hypothetical protein
LTWQHDGTPSFDDRTGQWSEVIALSDLLLLGGQRDRAHKLLSGVLSNMQREVDAGRIGAVWIANTRAIALALLGRDAEVLPELSAPEHFNFLVHNWRNRIAQEPAYERLRTRSEYLKLAQEFESALARERAKLSTSAVSTQSSPSR